MDSRQFPGVDVVHDLESIPYPFSDASVLTIKAAHCAEHLPPKLFFPWMDELWRLLVPDGQVAISVPYAGSPAFYQDPTHTLGLTERSWQYLDPDYPTYPQYRPKPWRIEPGFPVWNAGGTLEVVLRKRPAVDFADEMANKAVQLGALQKPSELRDFIALVKPLPLSVVVEIGTARGGVWWALCQLARPDALLVSIDLPGGPFGGGYTLQEQQQFATYGKGRQQLVFLRNDSHKPVTKRALVQALAGRTIDLLFIDGDHTYRGVKQDYAMYGPLVTPGGLIAFHDICFHPAQPECRVDKFWREVKAGKHVTEFIHQQHATWGGIGVIHT